MAGFSLVVVRCGQGAANDDDGLVDIAAAAGASSVSAGVAGHIMAGGKPDCGGLDGDILRGGVLYDWFVISVHLDGAASGRW